MGENTLMTIEQSFVTFDTAVQLLAQELSFASAEQFCQANRSVWGKIFMSWLFTAKTEREKHLDRFALLCKNGLKSACKVEPKTNEEIRELTSFIRNCRNRLMFARVLIEEGPDATERMMRGVMPTPSISEPATQTA